MPRSQKVFEIRFKERLHFLDRLPRIYAAVLSIWIPVGIYLVIAQVLGIWPLAGVPDDGNPLATQEVLPLRDPDNDGKPDYLLHPDIDCTLLSRDIEVDAKFLDPASVLYVLRLDFKILNYGAVGPDGNDVQITAESDFGVRATITPYLDRDSYEFSPALGKWFSEESVYLPIRSADNLGKWHNVKIIINNSFDFGIANNEKDPSNNELSVSVFILEESLIDDDEEFLDCGLRADLSTSLPTLY